MSPTTEDVLQSALALSTGDQVELIEALIAALDEAEPPPLDDAWLAVIRRRSAELDSGKVAPIPWPVVRDRARQLNRHD